MFCVCAGPLYERGPTVTEIHCEVFAIEVPLRVKLVTSVAVCPSVVC